MTYFHVPLIIAHFNLRQPKKTPSELFLVKFYIPGIAEQNVSVVLMYFSWSDHMRRSAPSSHFQHFISKMFLSQEFARYYLKLPIY